MIFLYTSQNSFEFNYTLADVVNVTKNSTKQNIRVLSTETYVLRLLQTPSSPQVAKLILRREQQKNDTYLPVIFPRTTQLFKTDISQPVYVLSYRWHDQCEVGGSRLISA